MIQNTNYGVSRSYVDGALSNTYTKAEVDTALATKANDNAVVHLAGAETIPGAKTFTANRGVALKATQSYNTFEVSSKGFTNNIEAKAYTTDGSASDQHFVIGTSYSNASREVWHAIAYAPRVTRGDTSEAQTEMRLSMNINNNNTGEAYLSFGRNDGVSAPDLVLGKFANGAWTPTMVNDALDGYLPMVRTTGNQTIMGLKTIQEVGARISGYRVATFNVEPNKFYKLYEYTDMCNFVLRLKGNQANNNIGWIKVFIGGTAYFTRSALLEKISRYATTYIYTCTNTTTNKDEIIFYTGSNVLGTVNIELMEGYMGSTFVGVFTETTNPNTDGNHTNIQRFG